MLLIVGSLALTAVSGFAEDIDINDQEIIVATNDVIDEQLQMQEILEQFRLELDYQELTEETREGICSKFLSLIRPGMPIEMVLANLQAVGKAGLLVVGLEKLFESYQNFLDAKDNEHDAFAKKENQCRQYGTKSNQCKNATANYQAAIEKTKDRQFWKTKTLATFNAAQEVAGKLKEAAVALAKAAVENVEEHGTNISRCLKKCKEKGEESSIAFALCAVGCSMNAVGDYIF
jgi:hypothetical protein